MQKDRNHTPSSHPSGASYTLSSTQPSPHLHSNHASPQPGGMVHPDSGGRRSQPQPFPHHAAALGNLHNVPQMQGSPPIMQSNVLQHSLNGGNSSDSNIMGRGVLPERRSPAVGQPAQNPPVSQMEMNSHTPGKRNSIFRFIKC